MVARYPDGRAFFLRSGDATYAHVFTTGQHEPAETRLVQRLLRPGEFALDVGANHGWFAIAMASRVGRTGMVWAVEPLRQVAEVLNINLRLNPQLPLRVIELALGETRRIAQIHAFAGLPHGHASLSTLGRSDFVSHSVEVTTLDDIVQSADAAPTVVKIDVEGSELDVLRGARETLSAEDAPLLLVEINYETAAAFGHRPRDLVDYVESTGSYATHRVEKHSTEPETAPDEAPHGGMWLFVPDHHRERLTKLDD
jgi:FkbM family methyltransferase